MSAVLASLAQSLSAALFPARCLGCGRRGPALCTTCAPQLPLLSRDVCPRCASPWRGAGACRVCPRISPSLTSVRAACAYEGLARKAVHTLKFRAGRYLAPTLGATLREAALRRPLQADLVLPAPVAPARLRERGYNQAELLAREVAEAVGGTVRTDLLARQDRAPQQTLSAAERRRNLVGAITCPRPDAVAGVRIVLVDDVLTTGATLGACADALTTAGATRVSALVFARDL
jgi:ComF family protein